MPEARAWKWFHYYWNICKHLGFETYRTWRQELFASVIVVIFTALFTGGWKDFKTAILATACTLGCFAIWHILRSPWLLHKSVHGADESNPGFFSGALGVFVIAAIFVGGYQLAVTIWSLCPVSILEFRSADDGAKRAEIIKLNSKLSELQREKQGQPYAPPTPPQHTRVAFLAVPEAAAILRMDWRPSFISGAKTIIPIAFKNSGQFTVEQPSDQGILELVPSNRIDTAFAEARKKFIFGKGSGDIPPNTPPQYHTYEGPDLTDETANEMLAGKLDLLRIWRGSVAG